MEMPALDYNRDFSDFLVLNNNDVAQPQKHNNRSSTTGDVYSTVTEVKMFLEENKYVYDKNKSRAENIILAQQSGKIPFDTIITFDSLTWSLNEGETFQLQDNIRLTNCEIIQGTLSFTSDNHVDNRADNHFPAEPIKLNNEDELKSLLGLYYKNKSFVDNISQALKNGNLPRGIVYGPDFDFNLAYARPIELINDASLDGATVSSGWLVAPGQMTVLNNARGTATGFDSVATTFSTRGIVCASDQATCQAIGHGKAFALNDGTTAIADGPNAKAYGLTPGSTIILRNGATGYIRDGVNVIADNDCTVKNIPCIESAPPAYFGGTALIETEKYKNYRDYVLELKDLADVGDAESAYALSKVDNSKLNAIIPGGKTKYGYLVLADTLGKKEAAKDLCDHFIHKRFAYLAYRYVEADSRQSNGVHFFYGGETKQHEGVTYHLGYLVSISGTGEDENNIGRYFRKAQENGTIGADTAFGKYIGETCRQK